VAALRRRCSLSPPGKLEPPAGPGLRRAGRVRRPWPLCAARPAGREARAAQAFDPAALFVTM